jgi:hypothetical protein
MWQEWLISRSGGESGQPLTGLKLRPNVPTAEFLEV